MLQNKNIYVSLQSQLNMVPIVQLVRASDCGSECRGFESHWAPKRGSRKTSFFRIVGSATLRRPDLPWFSNNFAIDIFMPVILAEKTANSFATITAFRDLPSFFTVFGNSCKKYPRFFCKDSTSMQPDGVYTHNTKCIRDFPTNNFCHDHQPQMSIIPGLKPLRFRHNRRTPMRKTRPLFPFKQGNTSI